MLHFLSETLCGSFTDISEALTGISCYRKAQDLQMKTTKRRWDKSKGRVPRREMTSVLLQGVYHSEVV
jgi:hypothetical protein